MISQADYEKCLKGFRIIDCVVRNRDIFYFTAVENYESDDEMDEGPLESELRHRVIVYFSRKAPEERWNRQGYQGMKGLYAAAAKSPDERFIGIDRDGDVIVLGGGVNDFEEALPKDRNGIRRGSVLKAKTIDGYVHVCTQNRGLARRNGSGQWTWLCSGIPATTATRISLNLGFQDFDAFNEREFYCAGGKSDVWYLDDSEWKRADFPAGKEPLTVCCAGDGWAYIGCEDRTIWRGRRDNWQLFEKQRSFFDPIPKFNDMVWFQDRVYCASDYALWEIVDDDCGECPIPEEVKECCGNLSVADGALLMAGENGAASFDGQKWTVLYRASEFRS